MKPTYILFASTVISTALSFNAAAEVTGRVSILWDQPSQLQLVPQLKLYPGVSMDIHLSGQVDIDHQFGERRRCKYFGAKCWYEQWDKPRWIDRNGIELELLAGDASATRNGSVYTLSLPLSSANGNYNGGVNLLGMLWLSGKNSPISRAPCIGRPARCSGGDLTITLTNINVTPRLNALEARLTAMTIEELDVAVLRSEDNIDAFLYNPAVASEATILRLVSILTRAAERLSGTIGPSSATTPPLHLKIIDLAAYADSLAKKSSVDAAKLRVLIAESHFNRGDFVSAKEEAPRMMAAAKEAYLANSSDINNVMLYARAFKVNASAWREKQARNSSSDIRVAIALLDEAHDILLPFSERDGVSKLISDINVDGARMLNVLRTDAELKAAEDRLLAAVCFQMHAEQGKGKDFGSWKSGVKEPSLDCQSVRDKK
jgi:hypothetical protein